ncbi:MAG TPA: phosphatidate cytidylyltransferase [Sedimenticola sp.]|nr:phosphatidate cytidylyltransferase [Sedimenticola sp.]
MLLQRLITALVLIPLVVGGVLYLPTPGFALVLALIVLYGGWEWGALAGLSGLLARITYLFSIALLLGGVWLLLERDAAWGLRIAGLASLWWLLVAVWLIRYRPERTRPPSPGLRVAAGQVVLIPFWTALVRLHASGSDGPALVLFLMVLIWVADSGAYFAGRRWGRVKLAPRISPGKTREGVYGALLGAALCGVLLGWFRPESGPLPLLIPFCIGIALVSVCGDLFESLLKRLAGAKDSGHLLPGHGGVLDRIDSLIAASPVFVSGLSLLGGIR